MVLETLKLSLDDRGVLTVTLDRPGVRNAFNEVMIAELTEVFGTEAMKPQVRAVLLRGAGTVFCSGGDLNWIKKAAEYTYEQNLAETRALSRMFTMMNECPRPLIAAVQGAAIGGGVGLVSVCDLVLATRDTKFGLSEVRLGIVPACIGPFVVPKIGASWARNLFLSGERFDAGRALAIGLIHEVVEDTGSLDKALDHVLKNILQGSPNALTAAKRLIHDLTWPERRVQLSDPLEYASKTLADLRISPEGQEGLKAFLEKRKPDWVRV